MNQLAAAAIVLFAGVLFGCVNPPSRSRPEGRVALVIGNGAYKAVPMLPNPPKDARSVSAKLTELGFQTELVLDADRQTMEAAVQRLSDRSNGASVSLLYYAGHATEIGGENILIPVTAQITRADELEQASVPFNRVLQKLESKARATLVFLDACRDNPFGQLIAPSGQGITNEAAATTRSVGHSGLASVRVGNGVLLAFATAPGHVALDGDEEHSPFTAALLQHIGTVGAEVRQMLTDVRRDVKRQTNGQQIPWDNSSLDESFYFVPKPGQVDMSDHYRIYSGRYVRNEIVKQGQATRLSAFNAVDDFCNSQARPRIDVVTAPKHGELFTEDATDIMRLMSGTHADCRGANVESRRVLYRPASDYVGADEFEFIVHYRAYRNDVQSYRYLVRVQ